MLQKFAAVILGLFLVSFFLQNDLSLSNIWIRVVWLILGVTAVNAFFIRRGIRKPLDLSYLIFPALFICAGTLVLLLTPSGILRPLVLLFTGAVFVGVEARIMPQALGAFDENLFLLGAFGLFLGVWALDFYFNLNWWLIILLVFLLCFLLLWSVYYPLGTTLSRKFLYCLFGAFLLSQAVWILLLWSVHYFTAAVVFFGLFYLVWIIFRHQLEVNLTRKTLYFHSILVAVLEVAVLLSSRWLPSR